MNTSKRGDLTEMKVATQLMEMGFSVSLPCGDSDRYDLIVDLGDELLRVQVKTASVNSGAVQFNSGRRVYQDEKERTQPGSNSHEGYEDGDLDVFVTYTPELDKFHICPYEDAAMSSTKIRVKEPSRNKNDPRIRWEEDYLLTEENLNEATA